MVRVTPGMCQYITDMSETMIATYMFVSMNTYNITMSCQETRPLMDTIIASTRFIDILIVFSFTCMFIAFTWSVSDKIKLQSQTPA